MLATEGILSQHAMKRSRKEELGQVFTPLPVAHMTAALLQCQFEVISLLDAGAGIGTLTAAAIEQFCRRSPSARPKTIHVTAYEIDPDFNGDKFLGPYEEVITE